MSQHPSAIKNAIDTLARLPGLGPKSAERIVFYLLKNGGGTTAKKLQHILEQLHQDVTLCDVCGNITTTNPCSICTDTKRDQSILCVVAEPQDISVIEKTGEYNGRYHILGGVINPVEGVTADKLSIKPLIDRVHQKDSSIKEVILATNPDLEGESTALYIARQLKPYSIRVTRLAKGLPMGATIEYADEITIAHALKGRQQV